MPPLIKRLGVIHAAGVGIIEKPAQPAILPGQLGGCCIVGVFKRGMVNTVGTPRLNTCRSKDAVSKKLGGFLGTTGLAPDAARDYFEHSGGGGAVHAIRVTDGLEVAAEVTLYSRHWGTAFDAPQARKDNQPQVKIPVLKVKAKNGGRWGGRRKVLDAEVAVVATDISDTAPHLLTGLTLAKDVLKDAVVTFEGIANKTYVVSGNTTDGKVTFTTGALPKTDLGTSTNKHYTASLDNLALGTGGRESLGVRIRDASLDPAAEFGMDVTVDGQIVASYNDLSMDPTSTRYVETVVAADTANDEIEVDDLIAAGTTLTPDHRPANGYALPTDVQATKITFLVAEVASIGDSKIKVVSITKTTIDPVPHRLTFTWDNANTKYTVAASNTPALGVDLKNLADFSVGAGEQLHKSYAPAASDKKPTVRVIVDHVGGAPADGKTFVIDVLPLPRISSDLANEIVGGEVVPDVKNKPSAKFRISKATVDTIEIASGDLQSGVTAHTQAVLTGTQAETFNIGAGASDKMKLKLDGTSITVTLVAGAARTAQQVCDDINAQALTDSIGYHPALPTSDNKVQITSRKSSGAADTAADGSVEIETVATDAYTVLGFTVGGKATGVAGPMPTVAAVTGSKKENFAPGAGTSDKLLLSIDGRKDVTVTLAATDTTAALVVTAINAAFNTTFGSGNLNPASASGGRLVLTSPWFEKGVQSTVEIKAVANNAYVVLGFAASASVTQTVRGYRGNEVRLDFAREGSGGYDGDTAVANQKFLDALDLVNSPLKQLAGQGAGTLQILCPGKTASAVIKQAILYAETKGHFALYDIPDTTTTEDGALAFVESTIGRSDHAQTFLPTFVNVRDPEKDGPLKLVSALGMLAGLDARAAIANQGHRLPGAGTDAKLPKVVSLATGKLVLNEELLTPRGVNVLKFKSGSAVVWGMRTTFKSATFTFKPHRMALSHYELTFLESFDHILFGLNNKETRTGLLAEFRAFFRPEYRVGNLDRDLSFEEACVIKIDDENNPPAAVAAGDLAAEVNLALPNLVERLLITVSRAGVFEGTAT